MPRLGSLVSKSLVQTEDDSGVLRYRLLETVRLYGTDKLRAAAESDNVRSRHRDYFLALVESFPPAEIIWGPEMYRTLSREQHNIRAGIEWSAAEGRWDLVGMLASRGIEIYKAGGCEQAINWLTQALEHRECLSHDLVIRCLTAAFWSSVGVVEGGGLHLAEEAIELAEDDSHPWLPLALAASGMALAHAAYQPDEIDIYRLFESRRNHIDPSNVAFPEPDAMARRSELLTARGVELGRDAPPEVRFNLLLNRGWALIGTRQLEQADKLLAELTAATRAEDICSGVGALAAAHRSIVLHLLGRHDEALKSARDGADLAKSLWSTGRTLGNWSDPGWELSASAPLGLALAAVGRFAEAKSHFKGLLVSRRVRKFPGVLGEIFVFLAAIAAHRQDWVASARLLGNSDIRFTTSTVLFLRYLVLVAEALGSESMLSQLEQGSLMDVEEALDYGLDRV